MLLQGCATAAPTSTNQTSFQLTIELQDGSKIIGKSGDKDFQFKSEVLGEMKLPFETIRSIECAPKTNSAKLITANGDTLAVQFTTKEVKIETAFGYFKLPVNLIKRVQVSAIRKPGQSRPALLALWEGNENGKDSVGGHDATRMDGVTFAPGKIGLGFCFDGKVSHVMVPNATDINFQAGQDFSIEAWIMPEHAPDNSPADELAIVFKRYSPNSYNYIGYAFYLANGGQFFFLMGDAPIKLGGLIVNAGPDLRDGKFHHVAVTIQRDSPTGGHLYVDGESVLTFDPTQQSGSLSNSEPLLIGSQSTPGYVTPFKGMIDELSLYNRALSASEIQAICTEQNNGEPLPPPASPVPGYSFGKFRGSGQ